MAQRRRIVSRDPDSGLGPTTVLAQDDEADIVDEVGAERDEETGDLLTDQEAIRQIGAVDAASVIENRRGRTAVTRKRKGEKNIRFNAPDLLTKYDQAVATWTAGSFDDIYVKQLTGAGTAYTIKNRPRSGSELYDAVMVVHGQSEATEYEITVKDRTTKEFRVTGRITLPDTRPAPQQGQPMQYPPPGYPPPGYPPQGYPPPGYPPPTPQQYAQQPAPVPVQQPAPVVQFTPPPAIDPFALMQQTFDMIQRMQASFQPPAPQYVQPPAQAPVVMPPPPQSADPAAQMAWMENALRLFQQMQHAATAPQQPQQPPPQAQAQQPQMMGPSRPAPPGMIWTWEPGFGFVLTPQAAVATPERGPMNPMYRGNPGGGGRPPYYPQQGGGPPSYGGDPPQQPRRPQTLNEQLRESVAGLRATVETIEEVNSLIPGYRGHQGAPEPEDDDSPVQVIDWGPAKGVINRSDGSTRWGESVVANIPSVLKWIGEQHREIQDRAEQRQQREQRPRQQLRPGYVEVTPGYEPPPGYRTVPVEEEEEGDLPPPPEHVPPPISPQRTWQPPIADEGES